MVEAVKQHVVFRLAQGRYGVDIGSVQEIIPWTPVTSVPQAPRFIEGIIDLRGKIIPVIDLRKRFNLPAEFGRETRVMVIEMGDLVAGFVVDEVFEVMQLTAEAVSKTPSMVSDATVDFIYGIASRSDQMIILLDVVRLLSTEDQVSLLPS